MLLRTAPLQTNFFMKALCEFFKDPLIPHPHRTPPICGGLFIGDVSPLVHDLLLS